MMIMVRVANRRTNLRTSIDMLDHDENPHIKNLDDALIPKRHARMDRKTCYTI